MKLYDFAQILIENGISVVPVNKAKAPLIEWKPFQSRHMNEGELLIFQKATKIAVVCGQISGNLYCIDIDCRGVEKELTKLISDIVFISKNICEGTPYIEKTPSGGIHIIVKLKSPPPGNKVYYRAAESRLLIESRGEGGYVIIAPSPEYNVIAGDIVKTPEITTEQLDDLIEKLIILLSPVFPSAEQQVFKPAKSNNFLTLNEIITKLSVSQKDLAIRFVNNSITCIKELIEDAGWTPAGQDENFLRYAKPGKKNDTHATINKEKVLFYVFSTETSFPANINLTTMEVACILKGVEEAYDWALSKYISSDGAIIRVAAKFYQIAYITDAWGWTGPSLIHYTQEAVKLDGKIADFTPVDIPKLKTLTLIPNYINYKRVQGRMLNLFAPPRHKPAPGEFTWSRILMEHVFGEQLELGYRYMQALYLRPDLKLPILALVSKEQETGKSTFINWLSILFGDNVGVFPATLLESDFNAPIVRVNIACFDETFLDRKQTYEKLKFYSTARLVAVNEKYTPVANLPCYTHFVLNSNYETTFAKIDSAELRFWVRKLKKPIHKNLDILKNLEEEAPAFLHYLTRLPQININARLLFNPEEIENEHLKGLKRESLPEVIKDLLLYLEDWFSFDEKRQILQASATDLKKFWFEKTNYYPGYIHRAIREYLGLEPSEKIIRYYYFGDPMNSKTGKPFTFTRKIVFPDPPSQEKNTPTDDDFPTDFDPTPPPF